MVRFSFQLSLIAALFLASPGVAAAQSAPPVQSGTLLGWTDVADLTLVSPAILRVKVAKVSRLSRREAPDVPAGQVRALVEADLVAALASPDLVSAKVEWLWQGTPDARGRPPIVRGQPLLLFARPVAGSSSQLQLVNALGQRPDDPATVDIVRAVLSEARRDASVAQLRITGVSDGFNVAGGVEGESESQFFLTTAAGKPMTLVLLRRPGAEPQLRVSTGELIDDSAVEVRPQTLLWRAFACGLPAALPARLAENAALARDWEAVRSSLGACGRSMG